ncbi:JmjC domain-containing protein [Ilumatobacter sp.]|uniref:JmjC domain-containing protein n=1 Tax=Ilumatobacter sp. TaxID=1967498 RepID=UPI003C33A082
MARCVGDVDTFESEYWGRAPLHRHGASADSFRDILTTGDLDAFLCSGIRRPVVRLVENGSPVSGDRYTNRARIGGRDFRDVVDPDRVAELFSGGATIVAQSLHRTHHKVLFFAERLGDEISHPIQANAYLTPPHATGLAPHTDGHDVIVVQLAGSKRWSVESLGEFELGAGDTLYVPAGTEHVASSNDQTSLHLTLGILRVTYRSVLERILRDGPARLDDPLPLRFRTADDDMHAELGPMIDEVRRHLASIDVAEVARSERTRRTRRPPRPGALNAAVGLANLTLQACVIRTVDWTAIRRADSVIRIERDGHWMNVPSVCARAIAQLRRADHVLIDDLVGLDDSSKLILARRLITAGFCRATDE